MSAILSEVRTAAAVRLLLAASSMFLLAVAGIELTRYSDRIASVWLANGAVLAVMMRSNRREWPLLAIVIFAGNSAANLVSGDEALHAIALSLCNLFEIGLMLALLGSQWGWSCLQIDGRYGVRWPQPGGGGQAAIAGSGSLISMARNGSSTSRSSRAVASPMGRSPGCSA